MENGIYGMQSRIEIISPIDTGQMYVERYGSREPREQKQEYNKYKKKIYSEVQEEKLREIYDQSPIERKEYSLQEHMKILLWIGNRSINIVHN